MSKISSTFSIILVLVVAILLVSISNNIYTKIDITKNKIYTLSDGTKKIVSNLKDDITLKLYMTNLSDSNKAAMSELEAHKKTVLEFVEQYQDLGNKIKLNVVAIEPDSEDEDTAMRYGLQGAPMQDGTKIYLGLVAINNNNPDREAVIPIISNQEEFIQSLEYEISKLIIQVSTEKKPKIGVLSSLPIIGVNIPPQLQQYNPDLQNQKAWAFISALEYAYEFVQVPKETSDLTTLNLEGLLIVHPKEISTNTQYAIDQYLLNDGKVILFTDELCVVDNPPKDASPYTYKRTSELDTLTSSWGLKRVKDRLLCDRELATEQPYQTQNGQYAISQNPTIFSVNINNLLTDDRITSGVQNMFIPYVGAYEKVNKPDLKIDELIFTGKNNNDIPSSIVMSGEPSKIQAEFDKIIEAKGTREPRGVAFRITGKFKTAFPDGAPKTSQPDEKEKAADKDKPAEQAKEQIKESKGSPIAILITDVDMLNDKVMFRQNAYGQTNSNFAFVQNLIEFTMGNADLISIRSKNISNRPFTVLEDIKRKAQENTQKEIKAYQDKEAAAAQKLNNLEIKSENGQLKISLTPEQMEESKKLREQMAETRKQIRKLQFQQRKDVETKISQCKKINFLLLPFLISVLGLAIWFIQNRRVK